MGIHGRVFAYQVQGPWFDPRQQNGQNGTFYVMYISHFFKKASKSKVQKNRVRVEKDC